MAEKTTHQCKGNILLVANWQSDVGYAWWLMENFWATIANHFAAQGISSYLIYPEITTLPDNIAASRIITRELSFSDRSLKNLWHIFQLIRQGKIRNIYLSDSPEYCLFYILLRLFGIRKIVVHDHTPGDRTIPATPQKILKRLIRLIPWFNADHFIAVTDFVCRRNISVSRIPPAKCSIARNGIHPLVLDNITKDYANREFNIPENRHIVVTTGRAAYYKGIDFFILCADELINRQGLEQLHFLFCGDGPDMQDFVRLCHERKLDHYVSFAGKRTDIKRILPSCSIGLHTSKGEVGYSLSILEYMSAGLATIVPDRPSTSGATRDGETGLIYQHENIASACTAIKKCLDDEFRNKLAAAAIKEVQNHFNIENTNKELIQILQKVYS